VQATFRTTTRAVELHGTTIPADSKVALLWASANHDPAEFPAPERFDITRTPNQHVAFASGIHYCLGASLARLEARLTTETFVRRLRHLHPDPDGASARVYNPLLRGLTSYPLVFTPA
jgi:cytochrome P450